MVFDRVRARLADPKVTDLLGILTMVLTAIVLILAVLYGPDLLSRTDEIRRTADLAACRSQAASAVTEARTEFDVARSERDTVATHLTVLTNEGLASAVTGDDEGFAAVLGKVPHVRQELLDAEARVIQTTRDLRDASARYTEQLITSRTNPAGFLAACRARG